LDIISDSCARLGLGWTTVTLESSGVALDVDVEGSGPAEVLTARVGPIEERETLKIGFRVPCLDITGFWSPAQGSGRLPIAGYGPHMVADATSQAPVVAFLGPDDRAALVVASSATRFPVAVDAGVDDLTLAHDVVADLAFELYPEGGRTQTVRLWLDRRCLPLPEALGAVAGWWRTLLERPPAAANPAGRAPACSTWYSFYQTVDASAAEDQARRARALGFGSLIVDDGWQTGDTGRTYAFCGDWQPDARKFPDMAGHVARVQELGLRYLLWLAPPLLGRRSAAWARFSDRVLGSVDHWQAAVLDPRDPEVRAHLVECCTRPVREWGVDGLKLDFIDSFHRFAAHPPSGRADCESVAEGAVRLLDAINREARAVKPDLLVEFRQSYIGPGLWPYGNLRRASDCPFDAVENRARTLDVRLVAGTGAVHADPLVWHPDAAPVEVARHLMNAAFAVPQVSVRLDGSNAEHRAVLASWLTFAGHWRDVLLDGALRVGPVGQRFPWATARLAGRTAVGIYGDSIASVEAPVIEELAVWNAGTSPQVALRFEGNMGEVATRLVSPTGQAAGGSLRLGSGLQEIGLRPGWLLLARRR
jgi:alpha-galactosidase